MISLSNTEGEPIMKGTLSTTSVDFSITFDSCSSFNSTRGDSAIKYPDVIWNPESLEADVTDLG